MHTIAAGADLQLKLGACCSCGSWLLQSLPASVYSFLQGMNSEQMIQCITGPSSLHMRETPIFPATSKVLLLLLLLYRWFGASFTASASAALH
jgi:hypothetical protein